MPQPIVLETPTTTIALDEKCPDCNGSGRSGDFHCWTCNGTGFILTPQGKAIAALVMRHFSSVGWIPGLEE